MNNYSSLFAFIQDRLPKGVYVYCNRPQKYLQIKFIDWNEEKIFYQFELKAEMELSQLMLESLKEIEKFSSIWNSPLWKAMEEEDV